MACIDMCSDELDRILDAMERLHAVDAQLASLESSILGFSR